MAPDRASLVERVPGRKTLIVSLDLETFPIERARLAPPPVSIQWKDPDQERLELWSPDHFLFIVNSDHLVIGQNLAYDMAVMMAAEPGLIPVVFRLYNDDRVRDIRLDQRLLDIASGRLDYHDKVTGYSLEAIAGRYGLEKHGDDPWRVRYGELAGLPIHLWPESAVYYAINDVRAPYEIWHKQRDLDRAWLERTGSPILSHSPARARYDLALHLASCWGVRANPERTRALQVAVEKHLANMRGRLVQAGLVRANGTRDTKAAKTLVRTAFERDGRPFILTKTGEQKGLRAGDPGSEKYVATDADTCVLSGDPTAELYSDYTSTTTLVSRLADLSEGFDLPLQPRYNSLLATGRTSSSKGDREGKRKRQSPLRGIQIQNNPRGLADEIKAYLLGTPYGVRECYTPRAGNVFVLADYSSAELCTLGQICLDLFGYSRLAELMNSGTDVHMWFGTHAYSDKPDITYEYTLPRKKETPYKGWRQAAKPIVYGVPGGMGPDKIVLTARKSYGVRFTRKEAERLRELYKTLVPDLKEYLDYISGLVADRQRCTTRHVRTGFWRGGATYSAAANHNFQHLAACGALQALWHVAGECYNDRSSALWGFRPVTFVHDEIVLEGPENLAHDAAMRLQTIMEREFNHYTPDVPVSADPVVTRVWSKDAEPVYGPDGRLVPWDLATDAN